MQLHQNIYSAKPHILAIVCAWLVCLSIASSAAAQQYPGVKCVVDGNQQCQTKHSIRFGLGKVFFANQATAVHFKTSVIEKIALGQQPNESLVLKANHQLAVTNQVKQQRCPITGKSIGTEHQLLVAGVKIFFHNVAAKEEMHAAESTWHRVQQVFATDVFAKNFVPNLPDQAPVAVADQSSKPVQGDSKASSPTTR